ncbi:Rhodanese-like protein [Lojkania enalia]|uniref:Rhodanese-like protein n=1 Tax=Lojkania enalia TaxID=147567 RepID=A0A9P4K924_9PLEO|nr:Rhodanese-like protein [Didymosphaeria enalia]
MLLTSVRCTLRPLYSLSSASSLAAGRRAMSSSFGANTYFLNPAELNTALKKNVHSKLSTAPKIIPLCASWFLPNDGRDGYETFKAARIPHARFFDLDTIKDPDSPYPHMLPSPEDFAQAMGKLGIRRDDDVVVYDTQELGIFSAPRVAWTLQVFNHPNIHILNNFRTWVEEGYPIESGEPVPVEPVDYPVSELDKSKVVAFEEVREIAKEQGKEGAEEVQILDARSAGRFNGIDPEPREDTGLSSGHIPHSISVPFTDLVDPNTKTLYPPAELKKIFESKSIDPSKPIISSCGTGVTAAVIDVALQRAGFPPEKRRLYDGSWTEWAQRVMPSDNLIKKTE